MPPLLQLTHISRVYQSGDEKLFALNDVSLEVAQGEFVAIIGASGSGKSTLMNIIGALDKPTGGQYLLEGESVHNMSDRRLSQLRNRKIGFVFQSFNLLARSTAVQNVEVPLIYGGFPTGRRRVMAIEALEKVGLSSRLNHRPTQLSGGQQQRVAIARALVTRPVLLLADEPTGALDSETTKQILALLHQLHTNGMTVVLVTHDPEVSAHAQRVITVRDGKILDDRMNASFAEISRAASDSASIE